MVNSRERVLAALNHQEPDRPPRDLGSTTSTGIHPAAYQALKRHLNLEPGWQYLSARAQLAVVEPAVVDAFGLDLLPLATAAGAQAPELDERQRYVDRWGVERQLPLGGHYYVTRPPLETISRVSEVNSIPWPEPHQDFSELAGRAAQLRVETDKALVLNLEVGFLHQTQFMRGFDKWLMDLAADPRLAEAVMDRVLDIWLAEAEATIRAVGANADVVVYADDIAFQDRPMVSPKMYRRLLKPRQQRVFDLLKASGMKVFYHSCGALALLLPDLVEMGCDAINPVQVSAAGMEDTVQLKADWGDKLTFWGGIDTQAVLPRGSVQEVRDEVQRRMMDLAPGGGYVLAAVHDVQPEVPPENLCAVFEAADGWPFNGTGE